jgi:hypothetical protein
MKPQCLNNLHQIGVGAHNYYTEFKYFPPGWVQPSNASALIQLLPYLEQASKYQQFDLSQDINSNPAPGTTAARTQDVDVFLCPADVSSTFVNNNGRSNYQASLGANGWVKSIDAATGGVFYFNSKTRNWRWHE